MSSRSASLTALIFTAGGRLAACCLAACGLAACSGGITTAGTTSGASGQGTTVSLGGSIGDFPLPPGSTVVDSVSDPGEHDIVISGVTAAEVSRFYTSALPRDGYTITQNVVTKHATAIEFTGHGYEGDIGAASSVDIPGLSGLSATAVGITLSRQ